MNRFRRLADPRLLTIAIVPFLLLAGCSPSPDRERSYTRQVVDTDGISVVENGSIPRRWRGAPDVMLLDELVRIGVMEGPDEYILSSASRQTPLAFGPDGQIGYVESRPLELRVYDRNGQFLWRAGRRGEGPGEFGYTRHLQYVPGEGWAVVASPSRLVFFDDEGDHRETYTTRDLPFGPFQTQLNLLPDGTLWYWSQEPIRPGACPAHFVLGNWRTMEAEEVLNHTYHSNEVDGDRLYMTTLPFSVAYDMEGRAWVNYSLDYSVEVFEPAGGVRSRVRREHTPEPYTAAERREYESDWYGDMTNGLKTHGRLPEFRPSIRGLVWADDELWAFTSTYIDSPVVRVDVFDPDGVYQRAFSAAEGLRWARYSGDRLLRLIENEEGVPQIVLERYRFAPPR